MSDVSIAPTGAPSNTPAPSSPAPAPTEAPINTHQISLPNPIPSQAPQDPAADHKGSEHRTPSRREAIEAAFKRAENPPSKSSKPSEKPSPKAAEAKAGHNQPPEETEKLNLKKRPDDQAQPRGERGQFARREIPSDTERNSPSDKEGAQKSGEFRAPLPEGTPYRDPPQRFSESAKRDWATAPETVRADVHRMHTEFNNAYTKLKADNDVFQPIRRFHEMAQQHGTTLERALTNYTGMEQKLRSDLIGGLDQIINNLGLKGENGQRINLRDVAYHVLSQSPEQLKQVAQGNQQQAAAHQIGALHQEVAGLKSYLQQMHNQQQFSYTRSQVDQFANDHPRFDELGTAIEQELRLGFDLNTAYRRAELLYPTTQAAQTRDTPAQTRETDRSISGSPSVTGSNPAPRRSNGKALNPREAIQDAINRVSGHF